MTFVNIYTDGACRGNPGPGGWAAILVTEADGKKFEKELSGGEKLTTNNRMELTAPSGWRRRNTAAGWSLFPTRNISATR